MKGPQWIFGLLISVFCISVWSEPVPPLQPELPSAQVQSDEEGWWGTGFMVGTVSSKGWESGFIWESGELEVQLGEGAYTAKSYPAEAYDVSVQPEYRYLWDKLRVSSTPVVIKYKYPFWYNSMATNSRYRVIEARPVESSFSKTPSFTQFPNGIDSNPAIENSKIFGQWQTFGLILHVARWGQVILDHKCTVYLHLGGMARIQKQRQVYKPALEYNVYQNDYEVKTVLTYETYEVEAPNVVQLFTYNEAICRYAEDAAISQSEVYVEYTGLRTQADTETYSILHSIQVESPYDDGE
ncbi:hypothetical protein [Endozoicomonas numazuensis]|uniref:Uncharacterized protein n=1 Tax=Endozoicomonas numazuensis TaxID=1137799 RepID=A0A081NM06_9GAMM|nr:hypothetical protein [Endozoicomonas numazuensis]KEQ19479.1 hypothetical protein GZ78_05985 [Endozoicomonas numazuensis]